MIMCVMHRGINSRGARELFVRNRGYRFIIRDLGFNSGCTALCINASWINGLLGEHGVDPVTFRKLSWQDLAEAAGTGISRRILSDLRPAGFWQMCDAVSLLHADYAGSEKGMAYRNSWFKEYPILVEEDIYEILLDEGFSQEDAMEITLWYRQHGESCDRSELRDMLELYDVPADISRILMNAAHLPSREKMIAELMKLLKKSASLFERKQISYRDSREVC